MRFLLFVLGIAIVVVPSTQHFGKHLKNLFGGGKKEPEPKPVYRRPRPNQYRRPQPVQYRKPQTVTYTRTKPTQVKTYKPSHEQQTRTLISYTKTVVEPQPQVQPQIQIQPQPQNPFENQFLSEPQPQTQVQPRIQPQPQIRVQPQSIFSVAPTPAPTTPSPINAVLAALRNPAVHSNFTGNIVEQTRAQADATKVILNALRNNELAAPGIDRILKSTGCLNNLDDAIQAVEESAQLLEANGPELVYLVSYVQRLEGEKDIIKLTKASADILRILDDLQPLFNTPVTCNGSLKQRIRAFRALSQVLDEVLNEYYERLPARVREALLFSSKVTSEVTFFLQNMQTSLAGFNCVEGQDNSAAVYKAMGDIMENLAFLFEGLEKVERANKIRNQAAFIKSIVDAFDDLGLDPGYKCGEPWDYKTLAQDVEDLAGIIESVGVQKLSNELGLDLDISQF